MALSYDSAATLLAKHGQSHVLRFWKQLDEGQREALLRQVAGLDLESVARMRDLIRSHPAQIKAAARLEPADVVTLTASQRRQAEAEGEAALRAGEVGVLLVAGGQGSRLGFEGPKGSFALAPMTNASLFAIHARKILALERKYAAAIPFYIMTSDTNDAATRAFFDMHGGFGLNPQRVRFFVQGMWPAIWDDGRVVLDRPGHVFAGPDGHGGILRALRENGMLDDMEQRQLKTLFYFQVDNPLVEIAEPAFVGMHRMRGADISVKVCAKRDPEEGLGVVVRRGSRDAVVEYTELTQEQKRETRPDGRLHLLHGSVAIHIFSLDFLRREASAALPLHVAHKKVPYCDDEGRTVKPEKPNAFKFEKFIFDVIPEAERTLNLEFDRADEFSPVKNAEGSDSPATARRDMVRKFARWLEACGVSVPRNSDGEVAVRIEIDPCFALGPEDLRRKLSPGFQVHGDVLLT